MKSLTVVTVHHATAPYRFRPCHSVRKEALLDTETISYAADSCVVDTELSLALDGIDSHVTFEQGPAFDYSETDGITLGFWIRVPLGFGNPGMIFVQGPPLGTLVSTDSKHSVGGQSHQPLLPPVTAHSSKAYGTT